MAAEEPAWCVIAESLIEQGLPRRAPHGSDPIQAIIGPEPGLPVGIQIFGCGFYRLHGSARAFVSY